MSGRWVPSLGGTPCPRYENLVVELSLASAVGEDTVGTFGQDEGLWVSLRHVNDPPGDRPIVSVQTVLWVPVSGWTAVSSRPTSAWTTSAEYVPLSGDFGHALGHLAMGSPPQEGVASWLADFLSDPAALILALQVMGS